MQGCREVDQLLINMLTAKLNSTSWSTVDQHVDCGFQFNMLINCWSTCGVYNIMLINNSAKVDQLCQSNQHVDQLMNNIIQLSFHVCWSSVDQHVELIQQVDQQLINKLISNSTCWSTFHEKVDFEINMLINSGQNLGLGAINKLINSWSTPREKKAFQT